MGGWVGGWVGGWPPILTHTDIVFVQSWHPAWGCFQGQQKENHRFGIGKPRLTHLPNSQTCPPTAVEVSPNGLHGRIFFGGTIDGVVSKGHAQPVGLSRSPSSALSHPFFGWEGSPTKINY